MESTFLSTWGVMITDYGVKTKFKIVLFAEYPSDGFHLCLVFTSIFRCDTPMSLSKGHSHLGAVHILRQPGEGTGGGLRTPVFG